MLARVVQIGKEAYQKDRFTRSPKLMTGPSNMVVHKPAVDEIR